MVIAVKRMRKRAKLASGLQEPGAIIRQLTVLRRVSGYSIALSSRKHSKIEVPLNVRFIHAPRYGSRPLSGLGSRGDQRRILYYPTVQGSMVHLDPTLDHDFLQITIGNSISHIEKYSVLDDGFGIVAAFEVNRHDLIPARQFKRRRQSQLGDQAHIPKSLRQNRWCGYPPLNGIGLRQNGEVSPSKEEGVHTKNALRYRQSLMWSTS
jgi:hypothetical protein